MKILSLHCDYIKFKAVKKALKQPEKLTKQQEKEQKVDEPLVILTAVEKGDNEKSLKLLPQKVLEEINELLERKLRINNYINS